MLAIAQGVALAGYWNRAILWGLATVIGGYGAIVAFIGLFLIAILPPVWIVFVSSAILGLAQAYSLRGESRWWWWWPLITSGILWMTVGWFVSLAINAVIYGHQRPPWQWMLLAALTGITGGALKGLALVGLLKQTPPRGLKNPPLH